MFLSKLPNGIYHIYYHKPNGKKTKVSTGTKLKSEALKFLMDFKTKVNQINNQSYLQEITLKSFIFEFLKASEIDHTRNTIATYKTTFNSFLRYIGNIPIQEIQSQLIQKYFTYKINKVSIYQARKDRINLGYAFNWAIKSRYLKENPFNEIPRYKIPEKQPLYFSYSEFENLIKTIDSPDIKDLTIFAVNTGLRQMELLSLKWRQIEFENHFVILDNQSHITKGKRVRVIPLNEKAYSILLERNKKPSKEGTIFTFQEIPMTQDFISKRFKKYILASKVNPKLNFHSLRHTFATWLIKKGAPIYEVSKLLGHADIKTTEIYSHISPEDLRGSINLLNNF